jgi:rsbT co-antagonist protein RsbR
LRWAELAAGKGPGRGVCRFQSAGDGGYLRYAWTGRRAPERDEIHASLVPLDEDEARPTTAMAASLPAEWDDPGAILRGMLEHCDIIVCVYDLEGRFVVHEGKGLEAVGLHPGQFLGRSAYELYAGAAGPAEIRASVEHGEVMHWHGDAHGIHWETWSFPLRAHGGKIMGAVTFTINRTDEKRALQDLKNKLELIERQQEVIRNLETPIIQVWNRVLTLPMVGIVDSQRAARVMNDLLSMIVSKGAHYAILDLTGVDTVDTATASHLLQMVAAIRLLGAEGIISGIRPTVAQTMVTLGVDLAAITTCANLQEALRLCIRRQAAQDEPLRR